MKIYTKTGDDGSTGLRGNVRVRKDAARIEAYGEIDELNAALGLLLAHLSPSTESARGWLVAVQNDLFVLGAILSTPTSGAATPPVALPSGRTEDLEKQIDQMEKALKPLKNFILPQGTAASAFAHLARAISRRAERRIVALDAVEKVGPALLAYVNRLSDFLFVLARWLNSQEGGTETAWIHPAGDAPNANTDVLGASLRKLEEEKQRRKSLFEQTSSELQKKKAQAEKNFRQGIDQINKDGGKVEPPVRPIDLD